MKLEFPTSVYALFCLIASAHGDKKLRRKRVLLKVGSMSGGSQRGLSLVQDEGPLDPDEDWDGIFFDGSALSMLMSMSMLMRDDPKSPVSVNGIYRPITEKILNKFCRSEHDSNGIAVRDEDGVEWYCRVTDDVLDEDALYIISIAQVCQSEFGPSYEEALLGGNADSWACVDSSADGA